MITNATSIVESLSIFLSIDEVIQYAEKKIEINLI